MHFPAAHLRFPHSDLRPVHIDLRRIGRDALIAAEIGLTATAVVGSARTLATVSYGSTPPAAESTAAVIEAVVPLGLDLRAGDAGVLATVHGLHPSGTATVDLVDAQGAAVFSRVVDDAVLRFEDVPAGRYRMEVTSIGPVEQAAGTAISSAAAVRSEPFQLEVAGTVIVEFG